MIHPKRIGVNLSFLFIIVGLSVTLFGEPVLVSIKKGSEGNKSWALFSFEGDVKWSGISQTSDGKLSLYFKGGSGDLNGSSMTLDTRQDKRVYVKQLSQEPPIFRADIIFNMDQPIAVLRKENHMIVAFNDERLLSTDAQLSGETATFPSTLYQIQPEYLDQFMKTSFDFDSDMKWSGYVRHSADHVDLIFSNADHNLSEESISFSRGSLRAVQLHKTADPVRKLKASLWFKNVSNFSIAKKGYQVIAQIYYPKTSLMASTQTISAPDTVAETKPPQPSGTSDNLSGQEESAAQYNAQDVDALLNMPSTAGTEVPVSAPPDVESDVQLAQEESQSVSPEQPMEQPDEGELGIDWNTPVSFEFRATPIKDALRLLAKTNNLNMVIGDGVDATVTMTLSEVTLKQALDKIVVTNGFEYIVDENIIIVKTIRAKYAGGRMTKVYRLKYADAGNVATIVRNIVTSDSLVQVFYPEFLQFIDTEQQRMQSGAGAVSYTHLTLPTN